MKIQRPNIKINKTWLMLIVAIILAILTAWLTLQYLTQKEQSIEADLLARSQQNRGETLAVVVPIRPLPIGALLDESYVAAREVPVDFINEDTITVAQFDAYKGQALIRAVEKGKPLRKGDVHEAIADFSGSLKTGKRAMTINVDEINSVSHMVEPGNMVDLMLVLSGTGAAEGASNQTVVPFLDQVKVLATGKKVSRDDPDVAMAASENRRFTYSNFTLEVTPAQAARLALATELGKIRAVLRNESDKQSVTFDSVNSANLMEDIMERERKAASMQPRKNGKFIEYFIGGKAGTEAVAPVINMPMMPGAMAGAAAAQPGTAGGSGMPAQAGMPQSLTDLVKLSYSANAPATSSK